MSDKIRITADAVISRGKGQVKYYGSDGSIQSAKVKEVQIFETQEELEQDIELASMRQAAVSEEAGTQATASGPVDEFPNDEQSAESAPAAAGRSSKSKRGKGRGKEQMATKKKASSKKAVRKASNGALIRSVAGREHDVSGYERVKNASGHTSLDCGDDIAQTLRGKTLDDVYALAAKKLKEDEKALRAKYKHLNPGMQRMSLGNRLRKVLSDKQAAA